MLSVGRRCSPFSPAPPLPPTALEELPALVWRNCKRLKRESSGSDWREKGERRKKKTIETTLT